MEVNSYHHQAIEQPGARTSAGGHPRDVIEALEADDARLFAVQWHPEQMAGSDAEQTRSVYRSFVAEASEIQERINEEMNDDHTTR